MITQPNLLCQHMIQIVASSANILNQTFQKYQNGKQIFDVHDKVSSTPLPDFFTETDKIIEKKIRNDLHTLYPEIGFVGEESDKDISNNASKNYFLLDPIDGTTNFVSLRDYFSISLAYIENDHTMIGVIANPTTHLITYACKNKGSFSTSSLYLKRKKKIQAAKVSHLREVQIDCEMLFTNKSDLDIVEFIVPHTLGMRKNGSTALDLSMMAIGRKSALIATELQPYDIAAGLLIAREAGVVVTDFKGNPATLNSRQIIAAQYEIHHLILNFINKKG